MTLFGKQLCCNQKLNTQSCPRLNREVVMRFFIHNKLTGRAYNRNQIFLWGVQAWRESNRYGR